MATVTPCTTQEVFPGHAPRPSRTYRGMPVEEDEDGSLVLRLKNSDTLLEHLASTFVGNPVHVDMLLHKPGSQSQRFTYTAFMGESFSMSILQDEQVNDPHYTNLSMPVCNRSFAAMQAYLAQMVESAVPYNYKDLPVAAGIGGRGTFRDVMFSDVAAKTGPKDIHSVFCSQAVVLLLRSCLWDAGGDSTQEVVLRRMQAMNSRTVTPKALFAALEALMERVTGSSLRTDCLVIETP